MKNLKSEIEISDIDMNSVKFNKRFENEVEKLLTLGQYFYFLLKYFF